MQVIADLRGSAQKLSRPNDAYVQEVLRQAQRELRDLLRERADIMKRIGTVKQTIVGLANMFGNEVLDGELLDLVDRRSNGRRQPGLRAVARPLRRTAHQPQGPAGFGDHGAEPPGRVWRGALFHQPTGQKGMGMARVHRQSFGSRGGVGLRRNRPSIIICARDQSR
jgi:hypothetical protein